MPVPVRNAAERARGAGDSGEVLIDFLFEGWDRLSVSLDAPVQPHAEADDATTAYVLAFYLQAQ